jgi:hypothetical protein
VILNVLGSGRPRFLLSHLQYRVLAPAPVIQEVHREPDIAIEADSSLLNLIEEGVVTVIRSDETTDALATDLAGAPSPDDLDDGEAYAIAHAVTLGAAIGIDERKGRRILLERWPNMMCFFTLDLFENACDAAGLAAVDRAEIVFSALCYTRMRVPKSRRAGVVRLLGADRPRTCSSLGPISDWPNSS